ncbi:hypothetical protein SCLCIDRAFT_113359 [Scleroderma citrinum Foug A]|uniref:Uncharacterized protein n=1 Tax=Scleroderma citrinum Foug A TaxID=1036808 RepID=A0A0C3EAJ9_9AGAM|nr:hypothetical protein SCLCIDRAFT_113359 [Scleroderma citrinum Foug A]
MTFDGESILSNDNDVNWDDDATLMALLDDPEGLVDNDRTAVVDRLEPVFTSRHAQEKEYTKQVFLRAIQNTKHIHAAVEEDISIRFLQAVSLFDNKSRYAEEAGRRGQQGASTSYDEAKAFLEGDDRIVRLLTYYSHSARELRQRAAELHDDVEQLISILDKKARQLGAEDDAKAKEKLLRGILEKY